MRDPTKQLRTEAQGHQHLPQHFKAEYGQVAPLHKLLPQDDLLLYLLAAVPYQRVRLQWWRRTWQAPLECSSPAEVGGLSPGQGPRTDH